jgi:methyl-accepting chemotaxis protein
MVLETATAAADLAREAQTLADLVGRFRLAQAAAPRRRAA